MKFESKSNRCISRKYIWKIHLKYGGNFFQASLCYQTDHLQNIMNTIMYLMPLHRGGFAHFRLLHTVSPSSWAIFVSLQWRHNGRDGVSKNQAHHYCSTVYSGADQRKLQSSSSLAFVRGNHRWPVNSPHKWPVTREIFPFDYVIMCRDHVSEVSLRISWPTYVKCGTILQCIEIWKYNEWGPYGRITRWSTTEKNELLTRSKYAVSPLIQSVRWQAKSLLISQM